MKPLNYLYILSKGRVAAVNKKDGTISWEIKLKEYHANSNGYNYGQISAEGDKLFVASSGILFCLRAKDGSLVWVNELKGWGYNFISMAGIANEPAAAAAAAATQAAVNAAVITSVT